MYEQDYIMRLIKEMVRMVLKLLFHIDAQEPTTELLEEAEQQELLSTILDMVDAGEINEAENQLFETIYGASYSMEGDRVEMQHLELALLFYSYLNDKSDAFLRKHNFSREEIKEGVERLMSKWGLSGVTDVFLPME